MSRAVTLLLILIAASTLTGCASGTVQTPVMPWIPPANVMLDCPDLPLAQDGKLATLLSNHKEVSDLYHQCQALNQAKKELIERHASGG